MDPEKTLKSLLETSVVSLGGVSLTVGTLLLVAAIVIVTFWLARRVRLTVEKVLHSRITGDEQAINIYARAAGALITVVGLVVALHTTGLKLTGLFAASGILAVAVGFATQSLILNFVSGVVLRFEGAIKINDVLEVGGRMVKIQKMMMRAVVARDLDDQDVVIPNAELAQTSVTNYTLRDRRMRLRTLVGVTYSSDMKQVREVLVRTAHDISWRSHLHEPVVLMRQFGSSSVDWEVSVWIDDPWLAQRRRSDLNEAIWFGLKEAGIVIAFPQLDLHLDPDVAAALGRR